MILFFFHHKIVEPGSILVVRPRTIIHKALVQPRLLTIFRFFHEQKVFTVDGG